MKVKIIGKTPQVITFNELGIVLHGIETGNNIEVNTDEQQKELALSERLGLIEVISLDNASQSVQSPPPAVNPSPEKKQEKPTNSKRSRGRPKGSKNKSTATKPTPKKVQKHGDADGSEVVIGTGDGVAKSKMVHSYVENDEDESKVSASLRAMEDLEAEEKKELEEITEEKMDVQDRAGGKAYIATGENIQEVDIVNSILPAAEEIKKRDPFIEHVDSKSDMSDAFLESEIKKTETKNDGTIDDSFLEI